MADFFQNGVITTLHNLTSRPLEELEKELERFSTRTPMSLVLPSLFSELEGPALGPILDDLKNANYLKEIVIGLDRADETQFKYAKEYFSRLPQDHRILWNDGPRLRAVDRMLADQGLAPTEMGKGRNVWYCFGYVLASGRSRAVALHDCDIVTYKREMLARLIYPVANPHFNYQFCKGYYSRIANGSLNGRVCRLLVTPLIRSLQKIVGHSDYLDYLDSFRYALAGEFSMRVDVLNDLRIPSDWGLEIGVISEMYRNYATSRICQVDIADVYDHKHQEMSEDDPQKGLSRMSTDITKAIIRKLATQGEVLSMETFRSLKATYYRIALDFVQRFYDDAVINGLSIDRHKEEKAVELFAENIVRAGDVFINNPMETPFMPSWNRVISAVPDILDHVYEAVEEDNKG
ncbi:glycosyl transferase [Pelobacter seleniigenes]|uniref:glycosyl transferase n=1 Tax=Pelobacter seleniigenes TaxID=407188 RepID=UPI0004A74721|nr:glycosyl transferase [Pelobacter seleniigenes]